MTSKRNAKFKALGNPHSQVCLRAVELAWWDAAMDWFV